MCTIQQFYKQNKQHAEVFNKKFFNKTSGSGQPLYNGRCPCSQCVRCSEVPLYTSTCNYMYVIVY